jgi:hypothetical protein
MTSLRRLTCSSLVALAMTLAPCPAQAGLFDSLWDRCCVTSNDPRVRSGYDGQTHCLARVSEDRYDAAYYVGGSVPVRGEGRYLDEGTFGWDYVPPWSRVNLLWTHGRRYQDGGGQYEPNAKNNPLRQVVNP